MEQQNFFTAPQPMQPLAARLRPQSLEEFVGQRHLLAPGKVLWRLIEGDHVSSMIFWGPPGTGKTTTVISLVQALLAINTVGPRRRADA